MENKTYYKERYIYLICCYMGFTRAQATQLYKRASLDVIKETIHDIERNIKSTFYND